MSVRAQAAPTLTIQRLTKSFGSNRVLAGIDLEICAGEFVGLMGPNGAGKSTLIKILDGVHPPTSGEIRVGGVAVSHLRGRADVGFVHQDLGLVDGMSVLDNLRLGERPMRRVGPILDKRAERAAAELVLSQVALDVEPGAMVGELSPSEKTLVAVGRVLARGARIIFVDEATSTLPPADARRVIAALSRQVDEGMSVVMVSHKLHEVLEGTTRVVLLLDGGVAADRPTQGLDRAGLVEMLLRHGTAKVAADAPVTASAAAALPVPAAGEPVLEMTGARGGRAGPLDLRVHAGEVVGLTGTPGSGLHDVAYLACGALRVAAGTVTHQGPRIGFVPPHRESQGGFAALDVRQNMTVSSLSRWRRGWRFLARAREGAAARDMVGQLHVRPASIDVAFGTLSGGNKQKVVFARALLQEPDVYVLCEPTRGVDVSARSEIYDVIRDLRARGAGILIVSSDAEDLLAVCDRVAAVESGFLHPLRTVASMTPAEMESLL
jgi:ribose transport system ATP-binding protein